MIRSTSWTRVASALVLGALVGLGGLLPDAPGLVRAQDEEDLDEGLQGAGDPRQVLARAVEGMGGAEALRAVTTAALSFDAGGEAGLRERHTLALAGRKLHYASRDSERVGFDVVIARDLAFLCDRGPDGTATYVDDLTPDDAREGAYERDMLFMPLLLAQLAADPRAQLEHKGKNSQGEEVVKAIVTPAEGNPGAAPFIVRLRFDPATGLLTTAMGTIPCGADEGRKRYLSYQEPKKVGRLTLPHRYADQRGKDVAPREVAVAWTLDVPVDASTFARPTTVTPGRR